MALFLSKIDTPIWDTLDKRQELNFTDRSGWMNNKSPWCRMTSLAEINGDSEIRKKWILFNGRGMYGKDSTTGEESLSMRMNYTNVYNTDTSRPQPGITDISVSNKGSMGSTREATITYVCWDVSQLNILEQLFMTPGISCILEWGWSTTVNNEPVNNDISLLPPMYDRCAIKKILEFVQSSGGHYDGMQGVISGFNWNLRNDGGFDCTTTIVSVASMFLEIETHSTTKNITKTSVDNELTGTETNVALEENILATLTTTQRLMNDNKGILMYEDVMMGWKAEMEMDEREGASDEYIKWDKAASYWVKWEFLEKVILNPNLFYVVEDVSTECNKSTTEEIDYKDKAALANKYINKENKVELFPKLNSDLSLINYNADILSGDPYRCLLPFATVGTGESLTELGFSKTTGILAQTGQAMSGNTVVSSYDNLMPIELQTTPTSDNKFAFKDILINLKYFYDKYKETTSLNALITALLDGISEACGGYWDFGLIIDEDNPTEMKVVDYNTIDVELIEPFPFKTYNKNSILTSVNLNTEVSEEIKSIIMLGTNRSEDTNASVNKTNGTQSTCEYNFYGASIKNLAMPKLTIPDVTENDVPASSDTSSTAIWTVKEYKENIILNINRVYNATEYDDSGASTENTQALIDALTKYVTDVVRPDGDGKAVATDKAYTILPLKLSFELDGISGLKFGNVIHIDYLPDRYIKSCFFQITEVAHTIGTSGWKTSVETIMRVNMNDIMPITNTESATTFKSVKPKSNVNVNAELGYVLESPLEEFQNNNYLWILDAGHGEGLKNGDTGYKRYPPNGIDDGSGVPQLQEWSFNRIIMNTIYDKLIEWEIPVERTFTIEEDNASAKDGIGVSITNRIIKANAIKNANPDKQCILLSIHANAQDMTNTLQGTAAGSNVLIGTLNYAIENTFVNNNLARNLTDRLKEVFTNNTIDASLDVWPVANVSILNNVDMPAILSENGFYTNPEQRAFLLSVDGQTQIVTAHLEFILDIQKQSNLNI